MKRLIDLDNRTGIRISADELAILLNTFNNLDFADHLDVDGDLILPEEKFVTALGFIRRRRGEVAAV